MTRILVPCDGSPNALLAVQHVVDEYRENPQLEVHLLNVQAPLSRHVAGHVGREACDEFYLEQAEAALAPARRLFAAAGVPHEVHVEVGDKVVCIAQAARRLRCDRIVIGTARKSPLLRRLEPSVTLGLIERAATPVEVIGGAPASPLERYGVPTGVGAGIAALWAAAT